MKAESTEPASVPVTTCRSTYFNWGIMLDVLTVIILLLLLRLYITLNINK